MAKLQLNKSSLARENKNLRTYQRFLPSLDLKRKQLMAERAKGMQQLSEIHQTIEQLSRRVGQQVPMLADHNIDLAALVSVETVELDEENVVGIRLPRLQQLHLKTLPYALLARPHWVDNVVHLLQQMLRLRIELQVQQRRVQILAEAVKTITQRVNLFDKVLIPRSKANIKRIRIYLSDEQMSAVVRSKISKRKHASRRAL